MRETGEVFKALTFEKPTTNDNTTELFVSEEEVKDAEASRGFNTKFPLKIELSLVETEVKVASKAGDNTIIDYTTFVGVKTSFHCLNTFYSL